MHTAYSLMYNGMPGDGAGANFLLKLPWTTLVKQIASYIWHDCSGAGLGYRNGDGCG
jgi:hypothetical protein